jgi:hypothetical protein
MAVTRIKNNQITDNTIEYQKLKDGTLVGTKFNANLTLNSNVSIVGNLQVTGNTTTINSINTFINDPLVIFNNGYVGVPSYDVGMLVNRNLATLGDYGSLNTAWVWSESDGAFIGALTTETGSTTGQINRSYFANIKVGNINATSASISTILSSNLVSTGVFRSQGNILAYSGTTSPVGSLTQGAIVVPNSGGVAIDGNLNVGGIAGFGSNVNITGNLSVTGNLYALVNQIASFSGVFYGDENGHGALYAGVTNYTPLPTAILQITGNVDSYSQLNLQNVNNGAYASGDIVVTANDGTDTTKYIDLGIAGSGYNYPGYEILKPHDGYLNVATGNLVFYLFDPNKNMYFYTGGTTTTNEVGFNTAFPQITLEDGVGTLIQPTTQSTNKTTGALRVLGGVGVLGNLHAGAINTTPIGNTNPSTAAFTTLTSNGATTFTSSAASSTSGDGAVVVTGGLGVGGNINVGSNLTVTGNTIIQGNLTVQGEFTTLNVATLDVEDLNITIAKGAANPAAANGAGITVEGANATITYAESDDSWNFNKKVNFTSTSTTVLGNVNVTSGNITTLTSPNFSSSNVWISGGNINNLSNLSATTTYSTNFSSGNVVVSGGYADNFPIGANVPSTGNFTTANTVNLNVTNGNVTTLYSTNFSSSNVRILGGYADNYPIGINIAAPGRFTTLTVTNTTNMAGNLVLSSGTVNPAGSSTQGALVLTGEGGAAIGGNVTVMGGLFVNYSQTAAAGHDTIIQGVNDSTLLWAKPNNTYDQVIIGGDKFGTAVDQGAKLAIYSSDSLLLPKGFNADRPSSVGYSDVAGMIRFSLTSNTLEYYDGTAWIGTSVSYNIISSTQFSAPSGDPNGNVDGSNAVFTLPAEATTNGCIVSINGVVQLPTVAYSIGGVGNTTLTFTEAPALGDVIDVRTLITTSQVTTLESATGFNSIKLTNSNVKITTGSSSTNDTVEWNTAGAEVNLRANVTVASSGSPAVVDSFAVSTYSSAEYTVTASIQGTDIRQICKVVLVTDGATTSVTQYSNVCTAGNSLVSFSGGFSSGSAQLKALTTNNNTIFRVAKLYQPL